MFFKPNDPNVTLPLPDSESGRALVTPTDQDEALTAFVKSVAASEEANALTPGADAIQNVGNAARRIAAKISAVS
jgi:hypothetical protein